MAFVERLGAVALAITLASASLGVAYVVYLNMTRYPPVEARTVALIWFVGALGGLILGLSATFGHPRARLALASLLLDLPNVAFAALYFMGSLMGDVVAPPTLIT